MNFKMATDALLGRVTHGDLAKALGVSVASIRQARLRPSAAAHRGPPEGWEKAVAHLAEDRAKRYRDLAKTLRASK
jgi:hypothetical protein